MTGAGKSWAARRLIEELAVRRYPIVIFDPHGDYTGLADVPELRGRVRRYFARFPLFEEDGETVAEIVGALGYELSETMRARFGDLFEAAKAWGNAGDAGERARWLADILGRDATALAAGRTDMGLIAQLAEAGQAALHAGDPAARQRLQDWGWPGFARYTGTDAKTLEALKKRAGRAAAVLRRMEEANRRVAGAAEPLPTDRRALVRYGGIAVVSLAGYTADFQATIYGLVADALFEARVRDTLRLPALLVLEEAHTFAPGRPATAAERRAAATTRQIAQEGRKFGVGLVLISQRPSRLDETTLSQCNSHLVMRMVNPADQQFVRRVVETLGEEEASMLPDLDVGEALLSGQLTSFPVLVRVTPPKSQGEREEQDAFEALERARRGANGTVGS
jgi:DNA helicase HerA-like ATPase